LSGKHALGIAGRPIEMVPAVMETTGAFGDKLIEFIETVHRMPTWSGPRDENFVLNTKRCLAAALYEGVHVAGSAMRMTWRMLNGKDFNKRQYHGRGGHAYGYKSGEDACRRLPARGASRAPVERSDRGNKTNQKRKGRKKIIRVRLDLAVRQLHGPQVARRARQLQRRAR
jgi:hypothetical protein